MLVAVLTEISLDASSNLAASTKSLQTKPFSDYTEGLFLFFINYFYKKEGFLNRLVV